MARVKASPGNRAEGRRSTPLLATALALGLLTALAVGPAWASAAAPDADPVATSAEPVNEPGGEEPPTTPAEEPTPTEDPGGEPEPTEPAPETTAPPPETTPPAPVTTAPEVPPAPTTARPRRAAPPDRPARLPRCHRRRPRPRRRRRLRRSSPPAPGSAPPPQSPLGVQVTTGDVTLTEAYWNTPSTAATLQVTVHNTGTTRAADPTLVHAARRADRRRHEGLRRRRWRRRTAAGPGPPKRASGSAPCCACGSLARRGSRCRSAAPSRSSRTRRDVPGEATDDQGFAVLFPAGPAGARDHARRRRGGLRHQRQPQHPHAAAGQHRHGGRRRPGRGRPAGRGDSADPTARLRGGRPDAYPLRRRPGAGGHDRRGAAAGGGDAAGAAGSAAVRCRDRSTRSPQRPDPSGADELPDHRGGRAGHAGGLPARADRLAGRTARPAPRPETAG